MTDQPRVEFRGRLVAAHYPASHAHAQSVTAYDFADGVRRDRIRYGDAKDRYPGGITYATREERLAFRVDEFREALAIGNQHWLKITYAVYGQGTPAEIEERIRSRVDQEEIRTDRRCPDCAVEVGEFHLPGCDIERCPRCAGQSISCECSRGEEDDEGEEIDAAREETVTRSRIQARSIVNYGIIAVPEGTVHATHYEGAPPVILPQLPPEVVRVLVHSMEECVGPPLPRSDDPPTPEQWAAFVGRIREMLTGIELAASRVSAQHRASVEACAVPFRQWLADHGGR